MGKLFQCHKTRLASPMTRDMHFHVSAMHIFKHYTPGLPTVLTGARITLLFAFIYCYVKKTYHHRTVLDQIAKVLFGAWGR